MRQYKVGDKVTIRSWESMEREFGADGSDDLKCGFVSAMHHLCRTSTTISKVHKSGMYNVLNGEFFSFTPQMFTDWETDNAKETKMQYNGQDVELITEGYWPEGVLLICSNDGKIWIGKKVFFLRDGHAIFEGNEHGTCWTLCDFWALLPAKPAPRRLTNREVGELCKKGWDLQYGSDRVFYGAAMVCSLGYENESCSHRVKTLRAPNSDEWLEPTSDLLEVGE